MAHNHPIDPDVGDIRVFWAIIVNMGLTVAQVIGGLFSGSLALIADALHNFSDAISLIIAFAARKIARRPANAKMTFGYGRAEVVAALVNYTTLIIIGIYLAYEATMRFFQPAEIDGWLVVIIAVVALLVDVVTAMLTFTMSKSSVNIRAAFLHNVADALGSVAVIFAGTLILIYGWWWVDPAVTLLISGYILWQAFSEIGGVIKILMLAAPRELPTEHVLASLRAVDGVSDVHHLHLWQMQEHEAAIDAHLVIAQGRWGDADAIKAAAKSRLAEEFSIAHVTLETECSRHVCKQARTIGHQWAGEDDPDHKHSKHEHAHH